MSIKNENGEVILSMENGSSNDIFHYGVGHENGGHSGRYPWGSGDNQFERPTDFYSFVNERKTKGLSEKDIAIGLGLTSTELRRYYSISKDIRRRELVDSVKNMKDKTDPDTGKVYTRTKIGELLGKVYNNGEPINESVIRSYENAESESRMNSASVTADFLMKQVNEKGLIDVGQMVNKEVSSRIGLRISKEKMDQALIIAQSKGYVLLNGKFEQAGHPGQWTNTLVLGPAGTPKSAAYDYKNIHQITEYKTEDNGASFRKKFVYPASMDSSRLMIRSGDEDGKLKDGVIEIRRGVKDLSLGGSNYAQVRILVDGTHYLKGMAVYNDGKDMPDGIDIIFNSNKPKGMDKLKYLKETDENLKKDPENPFGATISSQSYYDDPKGKYIDPITGKRQSLSLINKRSDEGEWSEWSKTIPSQLLSKQPKATINKQLTLSIKEKHDEYDEILKVNNPTVKAKLLEDFANDLDASSVELKAASFPGTRYHVILPGITISDNEIYAPNFPNGSQLALVRFPHGGTFEIPILTVNNNLQEGKKIIGPSSPDAVMISAKVAQQLSGADFDGDTVLTIPTNVNGTKIKNKEYLEDLKNFDTGFYGPDPINGKRTDPNGDIHYYRNGIEYKHISEDYKQIQMGVVSNLITDMTLQGATDDEIVRAVKHSMVVIDAYKHHLDYSQSYKDNNINELKQKYQKHVDNTKYGGAATLLSKAKSPLEIPQRAEGRFILNQKDNKDNGNVLTLLDPNNHIYLDEKTNKIYKGDNVRRVETIDPKTGALQYHNTLAAYTKVKYVNESGNEVWTPAYVKYKSVDENGVVTEQFKRPRYIVHEINDLYYKNSKNEFIKVSSFPKNSNVVDFVKNDKAFDLNLSNGKETIMMSKISQNISKMSSVQDARKLSSGLIQEEYYAQYANELKALANKARLDYLYYDKHPIEYSADAKKEYEEEVKSLNAKIDLAQRNAPRERAANMMANAIIAEKQKASSEEWTKDELQKRKQAELTRQRAKYGAKNMNFIITDKEWEAIQKGAITKSLLQEILRYADQDRVRKLATPRQEVNITESQIRRIRGLAAQGETNAAIAKRLGISTSTVSEYLNGKEN